MIFSMQKRFDNGTKLIMAYLDAQVANLADPGSKKVVSRTWIGFSEKEVARELNRFSS